MAHNSMSNTSSWPTCFSWLTDQFLAEYNKPRREESQFQCFYSGLTGITKRYLPFQYYTHTEVHADKVRGNKCEVSWIYRWNKHNFAAICCFSWKIKHNHLKSRFLSWGFKNKLSNACDIKALEFHFLYI